MVQKRDSPDCVKVGYQGEFPGFEMGNKTMAVLVAHKGLLEVHTCIYSHVGPNTKDWMIVAESTSSTWTDWRRRNATATNGNATTDIYT